MTIRSSSVSFSQRKLRFLILSPGIQERETFWLCILLPSWIPYNDLESNSDSSNRTNTDRQICVICEICGCIPPLRLRPAWLRWKHALQRSASASWPCYWRLLRRSLCSFISAATGCRSKPSPIGSSGFWILAVLIPCWSSRFRSPLMSQSPDSRSRGLALTLANGWLLTQLYGKTFGFLAAMLLVSFASAIGATLAFLLSRYLFRDSVQARFGMYLEKFNRALERDGAFYLFTLRLIPQVPFFVINVVMGLTPMPARTFWWVSQLGMLPGTAVIVYAGSAIPSLRKLAPRIKNEGLSAIISPSLVIAFILLGLFPLVVKKMMSRFRPTGDRS